MPKETDPARLRALRAVFADTASNAPEFTQTARTGSYRNDEGLDKLLPRHWSRLEKQRALKRAVVQWLDAGNAPTREDAPGDAEMALDATTFYHFHGVEVAGSKLFVKVRFEVDPREPGVVVISVKRLD